MASYSYYISYSSWVISNNVVVKKHLACFKQQIWFDSIYDLIWSMIWFDFIILWKTTNSHQKAWTSAYQTAFIFYPTKPREPEGHLDFKSRHTCQKARKWSKNGIKAQLSDVLRCIYAVGVTDLNTFQLVPDLSTSQPGPL